MWRTRTLCERLPTVKLAKGHRCMAITPSSQWWHMMIAANNKSSSGGQGNKSPRQYKMYYNIDPLRFFDWLQRHEQPKSSTGFFIELNHLWGTWVNMLAMLQFNVIKVTSMDSSSLSASFLMVLNLLLISITLAALVCTLALPVNVSDTQRYMNKESVHIYNFFTSSLERQFEDFQ